MPEGPVIRPANPEYQSHGATPKLGETRCESCGTLLTPGNSTLYKGFCDTCAQKHARSMFF